MAYMKIALTKGEDMKTIAFVNHKGGVGKTAISMAFAEALNLRGYKTLLVDLDQQMNATMTAGVKTDDVVTVYDLLTSFEYTAKDGIQNYKHGDILSGDILVADAENEMSKLDTPLTMLADALESVENAYDYVIIDCPPSIGLVTKNAIVAADELIVVVLPDTPSVDGFGKVATIARSIKSNKRLNPTLSIAGVVINTYDAHGTLDKQLDKTLPVLANEIGTKVFNTRIRRCVSVRKAQSSHQSLFDFDPNCTSAQDLQNFVNEYLNTEVSYG